MYYASANATLIAVLDRLFYSSHFDKTMKVGASVVCARRGGCSATFDELNKYFTISNMPIASSQYWNSIHGLAQGEAEMDEEGKQTMRVLARNMVFLMKSIALGKEMFGLPDCKGICRKCGKNLNDGPCGCDTVELDPRMAVIAEIFKNSK